jgi:hypothetical protein
MRGAVCLDDADVGMRGRAHGQPEQRNRSRGKKTMLCTCPASLRRLKLQSLHVARKLRHFQKWITKGSPGPRRSSWRRRRADFDCSG